VHSRDLLFPLNVYAHLLQLETGRGDGFHYGLFQEASDDVGKAQQAANDLILNRLASMPRRVLEIEFGLGNLTRQLTAQGHGATGITLELHRSDADLDRHELPRGVSWARLDEHAASGPGFDVVLVRESVHLLDPLVLFDKAFRLLDDGGHFILLGEFGLVRDAPGLEPLPFVDHFIAQAERCGFSLAERRDLSQQAAPTLAYLQQMLAKHRATILADLDVSEAQLSDLGRSLFEQQQNYQSGRYGYLLLEFLKAKPPRWRITAMQPEDKPAILELFEIVFGYGMNPALWDWKYADGRGRAILAWRDDQLVAHYGGMGRDVIFRGMPVVAIEPCDVMVRPSDRGGRRGPFFLTTTTFLERYVGNGSTYWLAFGFPNRRHLQTAEHLGLYAELTRIAEVAWSSRVLRLSPMVQTKLVGLDEPHDVLDQIWQSMTCDLAGSLVGVRDGAYVERRYLRHPENRYHVYMVRHRRDGSLGVVVLKQEKRYCLLMDVVGPLGNIPVLVEQARHLTARLRRRSLRLWITESHARYFDKTGGRVRLLDFSVPINLWTQGPSEELLRDAWWLTAGDTDFL
jgi:SAM-dependent methyltransferase